MDKLNLTGAKRILDKMEGVNLGYIYGSLATGKKSPLSNIDIGILLDKSVDVKDYVNNIKL